MKMTLLVVHGCVSSNDCRVRFSRHRDDHRCCMWSWVRRGLYASGSGEWRNQLSTVTQLTTRFTQSWRRHACTRPIATDAERSVVYVWACWAHREPCKTAEPIEMPFRVQTCVGTKNHVLYGDVHQHHLANTTEQFVLGGDASFLMSNYSDHLFIFTES